MVEVPNAFHCSCGKFKAILIEENISRISAVKRFTTPRQCQHGAANGKVAIPEVHSSLGTINVLSTRRMLPLP